jgi:hypothetical protein
MEFGSRFRTQSCNENTETEELPFPQGQEQNMVNVINSSNYRDFSPSWNSNLALACSLLPLPTISLSFSPLYISFPQLPSSIYPHFLMPSDLPDGP